ncbi:MAG TPA: hypothetical protein VFD73_06815 [Gemmatimonadales bacterium]|jgi:hypothetical protein|nr:hypothetical protein [Gemmatimonadales bacterium]
MDERAIRVLEEMRDLVREQGIRQERALALQEASVANQQRAMANQRGVVRWLLPVFLVSILLILVPYVWRLIVYFLVVR